MKKLKKSEMLVRGQVRQRTLTSLIVAFFCYHRYGIQLINIYFLILMLFDIALVIICGNSGIIIIMRILTLLFNYLVFC